MKRIKELVQVCLLTLLAFETGTVLANEDYKEFPWNNEDGFSYMSPERWGDPTYDHVAEAKDIADYLHQTEVYLQLPKALKEKLDANQHNYFTSNPEGLYGDSPKKEFILYSDRNAFIMYVKIPKEEISVHLSTDPQSLDGYVMASYEPSPAIDRRTKKPYFSVPKHVLNRLSPNEKAFFEAFLEVVNENYHFLTAYPLLTLEEEKFKNGDYWAKLVPAQFLVTDGSLPKPDDYQSGLKDEIQLSLGEPVYDLSVLKVRYKFLCPEYNDHVIVEGTGGATAGFFRYNPRWKLDYLQIVVYGKQVDVQRFSLIVLKQGLEEVYQIQKPSFSKEADFIYQKLMKTITSKIDERLSRLPTDELSSTARNLPKYRHLKCRKAHFSPKDQTLKIRAE